MALSEQVANSFEWGSLVRHSGTVPDDTMPEQSPDSGDRDTRLLAKNRRSALLNCLVQAEILPRLTLAQSATCKRDRDLVTTESDTLELVRLLLIGADSGALTFIQSLELRGASPSSLYLGIVTEAARRLGELWEDDRCDFTQVTISLGRLQQLVRALSPAFQKAAVRHSVHAETVLLLPAPGEQHTLGLIILAEFFQREGWHLTGGPISTGYDAAELVRQNWVDVAGFSIGAISRLDSLTACIRSVRKASRNRHLGVMVGGPLFLQHPELVARVGADITAADAPGAVCQARSLLAMRLAAV